MYGGLPCLAHRSTAAARTKMSCLSPPLLCRVSDHAPADSVLHRTSRVEEFALGEQLALDALFLRDIVDAHQRRVAEAIGDVVLELSEPCAPCSKIGTSFTDRSFDRVNHNREFGWSRWLARVLREGTVKIGDSVNIIITPNG